LHYGNPAEILVKENRMSHDQKEKTFAVEEAVLAQKALRELAGLGPEMFSIQAFVGMISDEVETLRSSGHTDEDIARTINASSNICISAADIAANYAPPKERNPAHP
jgi:hypothetical protein